MPTRLDYRQAAAKEIGSFHSGTADATSNENYLIDLRWPIRSNNDQTYLFDGHFLYLPDGPSSATYDDHERLVLPDSGYDPTTGKLTPDLPWSASPRGLNYELHGVLPVSTMHDLINDALRLCYITVEILATPVANVTRHAISTVMPYITDPRQVRKIGYLGTGEARNQTDPYRRRVPADVRQDANVIYMDHPGWTFNVTDTICLMVIAPAYYFCRASAAGIYGDVFGLSADGNEAIPPLDWVSAGVRMLMWDRFAQSMEMGNRQEAAALRAEAAALFTDLGSKYFDLPPQQLGRMPVWGPRR